MLAKQRFAKSSAPDAEKRAFLGDLPKRQVQDALLVICGETNITSLDRCSGMFHDPYSFADRLREMHVRVVLNPIHDYMRRYEMRMKRQYYSLQARTVISVWNQGKGSEPHLPWTIYLDGHDRTKSVVELPRSFKDRPDIRIGVLDLSFSKT